MNELWTPRAGGEFGAEWLEREIAPAGEFGRRARLREQRFAAGDEDAAQRSIARVHRVSREVAPETLASIADAVAGCPDASSAIARARAGGTLADSDFFDLSRFMESIETVRGLCGHPAFAEIATVPWPAPLADALGAGRTAQRGFYLGDAFSSALAQARERASTEQARYDAERSRLSAHIAAATGLDHVRDGEFVLMREHAPSPLPPEIRVLREAATYLLCEIALDDAAVRALERLDAALTAVAEEEDAVRASLSREVGEAANDLAGAVDALGALDAFVARARFAARYDCCLPAISPEPEVSFEDARFLPLAASLRGRHHRYVPLTLALDGVAVLTGPNMGGKSAALRTCGFVAACAALGVPVPASAARVGLFDEIAWIGAGVEDERASLLSAFGREVAELRDFFVRYRRRALVLVDEFARSTSPREGRALLIALVERLRDAGATALVATHLSRIAEDAGVAHFGVAGLKELPVRAAEPDLDAAIERIAEVMDYRIGRVAAGEETRADALALADVLGLDSELVARARAVL